MGNALTRALGGFVETATWALTGLLVAIVSANVFARYVLEVGILWAEEASRLLFVWVVFLGAYVALRRKGHMAIEILVARLPGKAQAAFQLGARVAVLAFLAVIAWAGFRLVTMTLEFGRVTPILGISAAWAYLSVPVAAILMAVETVAEIAGAWPFRARPEIAPGSAPGSDMREVGP